MIVKTTKVCYPIMVSVASVHTCPACCRHSNFLDTLCMEGNICPHSLYDIWCHLIWFQRAKNQQITVWMCSHNSNIPTWRRLDLFEVREVLFNLRKFYGVWLKDDAKRSFHPMLVTTRRHLLKSSKASATTTYSITHNVFCPSVI